MQILQRDKLTLGGFEGVREYRLVVDQRLGMAQGGAWQGLANFVYLADARFVPHGETKAHKHKEVDVISIVLEGRIRHEGSMEQGKTLEAYDVQIQRAGGEGFSHNEVNPDESLNRMIQMWVLPENKGEPADYRFIQPASGGVTRIYGGRAGESELFAASTCIEVARLRAGQSLDIDKAAMIYVCQGRGFVNEDSAAEGDLLRVDQLTFDATEDTFLVIIHQEARQ